MRKIIRLLLILSLFSVSELLSQETQVLSNEFISKNGYGLDIRLLYNSFSGGLSEEFDDQGGFGIEFSYLRGSYFTSLIIDLGFGSKKQDRILADNYIWENGEVVQAAFLDFDFGRRITVTEKNFLVPFLSLGGAWMGPGRKDFESKGFDFESPAYDGLGGTFTYGFGLMYDLRIYSQIKEYVFFKPIKEKSSIFVRFKVGYKFLNWNSSDSNLKGGMFYAGIGVAGIGRRIKQK